MLCPLLLLCGRLPEPLMSGGTGSESQLQEMPPYLPERSEAGTLNVPGIAGLTAGMDHIRRTGLDRIFRREQWAARECARRLERLGVQVFAGDHQVGTVSFVPEMDCEEMAERLGKGGIAVRAGLHCAPLAHESAGTVKTGTVRVSFGHEADMGQILALEQKIRTIIRERI